ncbi:MAG: anti-sigma factor [Actinomycetota bacterium]|nr:anti-sigma factor [Actinomycetota bacterium]
MSDFPCEHSADAAGWVLGSLSPRDAERFAAHLEGCSLCRAEVARLTGSCEQLIEAVPLLAPPPELRKRVMASVRADAGISGADPPAEPVLRIRRSAVRFGLLLAILATMAVAIVAVVVLTTDHPSQGGVRTVVGKVAPKGGPGARAVVRIGAHEATLVLTRLAAPPSGRIYQAWVVRGGSAATPTGSLFSVPRSGDTRIVLPPLRDVVQVIITAEPPRGSPTPTLPPVVLVKLAPSSGARS